MGRLISEKYAAWQAECEERFQQLKKNEEELNRIFIDIYQTWASVERSLPVLWAFEYLLFKGDIKNI